MEGFFEVTYGDVPVGKAELIRQGLYYRVICRCAIPDGDLCRLVAVWTGGWKNLGIPIPDSAGFILQKSLPVKHIGDKELRFLLLRASDDPDAVLTPEQVNIAESKDETVSDQEKILSENAEEEPEEKRSVTVPIQEEEPFEKLHEVMNAKLEIREEGLAAVFENQVSDIETEADGAVIGAQDISVDGSGSDFIPDTV